jgi:hypothetical protein
MNRNRRLMSFLESTVAVAVLMAASASQASAADSATCTGGSIASGVYSSLQIAGDCSVNKGPVIVVHDLTVLPGATLIAVTGGFPGAAISSDLTVGGNLDVQAGGVVNLGCEPFHFKCPNDPTADGGKYSTRHTIAGNLTAEDALKVVVHHTDIGLNVSVDGGGGGVSCAVQNGVLPYADMEDNTIGGNLRIIGWQSCWLGLVRTTVMHNVDFDNNVTFDPDGNEVTNNTVGNNLNCSGNSPSPQIGDSKGAKTMVIGNATDQCNNPSLVISAR